MGRERQRPVPPAGARRRARSSARRPRRAVERYNARDGLTGDLTLPLLEDREGNIWVGTTLGLDQFRAANVVVERQLVAMPSNGFGLLAASDGSVYAGTADGVFAWRPAAGAALERRAGRRHDLRGG